MLVTVWLTSAATAGTLEITTDPPFEVIEVDDEDLKVIFLNEITPDEDGKRTISFSCSPQGQSGAVTEYLWNFGAHASPQQKDTADAGPIEFSEEIMNKGQVVTVGVTHIADGVTCSSKGNPVSFIHLVPIDMDFIHPATGEMNESREEHEGGYIAIHKDEETPVTKLKLHKLEGMPSAEFKLVFSSTKIKIWKDANRTQAITSDSTLFPANVDTELFLEGVEKSAIAKDIEIGLKVKIGSTESSTVTAKATVVQSEFKTTIQAFIPYLWIDVPGNWLPGWIPGTGVISDAVAIGDNRGYDDSLTRSFRVRQTIVVIPFADLASDQTKTNEANPGASEHYKKSTSVPQAEQSQKHGCNFTSNPELLAGPSDGLITGPYETIIPVSSKKVSINTYLWANEGILGMASLPIRWNMTFTFDITDPVLPKVSLTGQRSGYPAFEVYVEDSNETNLPIYEWTPDPSRDVWSLGLFESFFEEPVSIP